MFNQGTNQPAKTRTRFFYGYILVIIAFFIMVVSWALYNSFGVFFKPLLNEFGWTSALTSGAFSLSMIIYGVLGIVVGVLTDRFGPRAVMTLCGLLLGVGYLLMSQVNSIWQLYIFYGVIIGIGMSGVWVPQLSTVARWFVKRRTLMTGIVIAGAGIGQLIGPPVISRLISAYDWRLSYIILGSVVLVSMVLASQFLRRDPAKMGLLAYGETEGEQQGSESVTKDFCLKEAASTNQFWLTFFLFFSYGYGTFAIIVHIVPHAIDLNIPDVSAANILATMGGVSILGNYVLGGLADRIGNRQIFIIGCIIIAATLFWLVSVGELWMLHLFAGVFGLAFGGMGTAESPIVARLFGLSSHGLIYGIVHLGFTAGAAAGPFVTGYIFDLTGSYQTAILVCAAFGVVGLILALILRPTKRLGGKI
jgi:MFS family permease